MEIYETDKITVTMGYNVEENKSIGKVRKINDEGLDSLVGIVFDGELLINEACTEPKMVKEEFHKLKKHIDDYDAMWKERIRHEKES